MKKLAAELRRLYLTEDPADDTTRALSLAFRRVPEDGEAGHWERLCRVANALQSELGLPAPAVSISGGGAYGLWLSLELPVPAAQGREFVELIRAAYCPETGPAVGGDNAASALPPSQDQSSGKWAAFIHPGMGASFAGDEGLEMQAPETGQLALLEGVESIGPAQFAEALSRLRQVVGGLPQPTHAPSLPGAVPQGLLLKDATLEDIVNFLHAKNIEPTFRFLK